MTTACPTYFTASPMGRREFLRAGSLGLFGLTLPQLLQAQSASPRPRRRAKACILLFMWGGPAHQDTWDMKPSAPAEYRGDFKPIATNVSGLQVCEHLPMLARRADRLAVLRSMTHTDVDHTTATHYLLTGRGVPRRGAPRAEDWPSLGAVLARQGFGGGPLPPFGPVMPKRPDGAARFVRESQGAGAGWLGPLYDPMRIDADASKPDYRVGDFDLHADVPADRTGRRQALLRQLDGQVRRLEKDGQAVALGSHYERAFSLLASRRAL